MRPPFTPRIRQLLLMLSSTQPGEVVNAAAAITRTLRDAGADWFDLVDGLQAPVARRPAFDDDTPDTTARDWRSMRAFCLKRRDRLRERELEFLQNLGRWRGDLTEKQQNWLAAIYARLSL